MIDSTSLLLSEYISSTSFENLGPSIVKEVKRRVLDTLGCAIAAFNAEPVKIGRELASTYSSSNGSTLWGTKHRAPPDWATFVNGLALRYLDFNDTYLSKEPLHPSDTIAAALAVGEAMHTTGRDLINAISIAYEIGVILCEAASLRARGWDHVNYTMIAATVAASKLMKLGVKETQEALALSIVPNVAMRQTRVGELSMWKGAAAAYACRNSVTAALLAKGGMTGPSQPFEGAMGFFKQISGSFDATVLQPLQRKIAPRKILETHIKFHPVEYHAQSAVDAALALRGKFSDLGELVEVLIETHEAAYTIIGKDPEKWRPSTRETADHSLPYCVAVGLSDGQVWLDQFSPERIRETRLQRLLERVRVEERGELTAVYPHGIPNRVTVRLRNGVSSTEEVVYPRGHARNPMTDEEMKAKFRRLAGTVLSPRQLDRVQEAVEGLEDIADVGELPRLLAP